jgi:hypothetical protein
MPWTKRTRMLPRGKLRVAAVGKASAAMQVNAMI